MTVVPLIEHPCSPSVTLAATDAEATDRAPKTRREMRTSLICTVPHGAGWRARKPSSHAGSRLNYRTMIPGMAAMKLAVRPRRWQVDDAEAVMDDFG